MKILFLFKKENIVMAFSVIIALKVIISSFTMSIYLKNTFKKDNKFLIIMSLLYAFSGYFCAYYWN
ncbi:YfhO family protein, partial [Methanosphaera sp.]|uniref:YfhO family protein n=1 Tax=Methanosphaera sp. TaxID=2666342 RepID=UPI003FA5F72D